MTGKNKSNRSQYRKT